jgi:hypothetical protein
MTSKARGLANLGNAFDDGALSNRNKIINGAMQVAQRGTSFVSPTIGTFTLDRYRVTHNSLPTFTETVEQVADAPSGFQFSWKTTVTATETMSGPDRAAISTILEGQDIVDLAFGTASAKPIVLSFWVRSSIAGTYSIAVWNADLTRSYVAGYTVSSVNTWEYKTVTIEGDTGGTWTSDSGRGMWVVFTYGSGPDSYGTSSWSNTFAQAVSGQVNITETLNATFQITGVQLEAGDTATPFEHRSYGQELALCQRYYYRATATSGTNFGTGYNRSTTGTSGLVAFPVQMRAVPTALEQTGTAANYRINYLGVSAVCNAVPTFSDTSSEVARVNLTVASGLTAGQGNFFSAASGTTAFLAWSAEL